MIEICGSCVSKTMLTDSAHAIEEVAKAATSSVADAQLGAMALSEYPFQYEELGDEETQEVIIARAELDVHTARHVAAMEALIDLIAAETADINAARCATAPVHCLRLDPTNSLLMRIYERLTTFNRSPEAIE